MTILTDLQQALLNNIDSYNRHHQASGATIPPQRANDIVTLRRDITQCKLGSTLRQTVELYTKQAQRIGFFSRLLNIHFCPLIRSLKATLALPKFALMAILVTETEQLAEQNDNYHQQITQINAWMSDISIDELRAQLASIGILKQRNIALKEENAFLSDQVAALNTENAMLRSALHNKAPEHACHCPHFDMTRIRSLQSTASKSVTPAKGFGTISMFSIQPTKHDSDTASLHSHCETIP